MYNGDSTLNIREITIGLTDEEINLIRQIDQDGFTAIFKDSDTLMAMEILLSDIAKFSNDARKIDNKVISMFRSKPKLHTVNRPPV